MTATTTLPETLTGTWEIDPTHSGLAFSVRHAMVATVRGHFAVYSGTLTLDAANPTASRAQVSIDAGSVSTNQEQRDQHLVSGDFLDVATYPHITFASETVTPSKDGYTLAGTLTIKDVSKPITIDVEFQGLAVDPFGNQRAGFEGTTTIDRKEFGLTWNAALEAGGVLVGEKVKVTLDISAIKQA